MVHDRNKIYEMLIYVFYQFEMNIYTMSRRHNAVGSEFVRDFYVAWNKTLNYILVKA